MAFCPPPAPWKPPGVGCAGLLYAERQCRYFGKMCCQVGGGPPEKPCVQEVITTCFEQMMPRSLQPPSPSWPQPSPRDRALPFPRRQLEHQAHARPPPCRARSGLREAPATGGKRRPERPRPRPAALSAPPGGPSRRGGRTGEREGEPERGREDRRKGGKTGGREGGPGREPGPARRAAPERSAAAPCRPWSWPWSRPPPPPAHGSAVAVAALPGRAGLRLPGRVSPHRYGRALRRAAAGRGGQPGEHPLPGIYGGCGAPRGMLDNSEGAGYPRRGAVRTAGGAAACCGTQPGDAVHTLGDTGYTCSMVLRDAVHSLAVLGECNCREFYYRGYSEPTEAQQGVVHRLHPIVSQGVLNK